MLILEDLPLSTPPTGAGAAETRSIATGPRPADRSAEHGRDAAWSEPALPRSSLARLLRPSWWRGIGGHVVLAVVGVLSAFPVYWMYATSVKPAQDVLDQSLVPTSFTFDNYSHVLATLPFGGMMLGTFVMAAAVAIGTVVTAVLASFALARWEFPSKRIIMLLIVCTWLVPAQATMLPNYVLISQLGLLETISAVVVPQVVSAVSVLMLFQHISAFPKELFDAATMDGRSAFNQLWTVLLPNLRPSIAAVAILAFISAWNEYFWPTMVMRQTDQLIQVGIRSFLTSEGNDWGALMAAAGLACLPVFALYLALQRQVVDAFVRSGLR
ncbi:carbohydrate ABC transporter permease [Nakamurella leprariae]|uniref:Carbohydrate ABC transporter permease n=1 Tax=Nakamurella leprariae TaxID=2803911 RepID=A0A938YFZ0_9ACTN|nr:carbohydrate ABC transporter permease [Nakamurella leprariae]MBM9468868.1 carbohydrate ABC transporter permease [Nakamurella leprariae]